MHLLGLHRQVHVPGELRLISTAAADPHARSALTTGHRRAVGQRHRCVAAVPADHDRAGRRAVVEPAGQERGFHIPGVEPAAEGGSPRGHVGDPRGQSRAVRSGRGIAAGNVGRSGYLSD